VKSKKYATDPQTQQYYMWMMIITLVQVTLGIVTLMTHVPVWLGVAHQLGALLLLLCTIKVLAWYKPN
jgi:cytochrome c oxidase assembly protein subunit 15